MARIIHVPVTSGIPKRRADGSVKLEFITNSEITTEEFMAMDSFRQSVGHLLFRENEFADEDVPTEDVESDLGKSQSEQVRDALWVLYRQHGGRPEDKAGFRRFYEQKMQSFKGRILKEVHRVEYDKK